MTRSAEDGEELRLRPLAEAGDPAAMAALGYWLYQRKKKQEALDWWRQAARAGDIYAMECLARSLGGGRREEAQQWHWLARAARRSPRTEQVPAEVVQAAAGADLGPHRATFGDPSDSSDAANTPPAWDRRDRIVAGVMVGITVLLVVGAAVADKPAYPLILAGGSLFIALIFMIAPALRREQSKLTAELELTLQAWVFERGFVYRDHESGQLTVFPWTRSRVFRNNTRHLRNDSYLYTSYRYRVTRDDGVKLTLAGDSRLGGGEVWVLGEAIEREITAVRLSRALTAIQEGKRLDFGPLSVDLAGISDGRDTLPWREVEAITTKEGRVQVKRAGGWMAWSKTHVADIPDVDVLLTLADALHRAARSAK